MGILLLATGPKRSIGHLLGGEKNLVAILTVPPWPQVAASMESCRFAARRSLGGRFWSVVDVRKRLHRVRGRFDQSIHTSTGAWQCADLCHDPPKFSIQSSLESPKNRRMRSRRLPTIRATPIAVRGPICMQKKEIIWSRWHPIPVKYAITRGPPVAAIAVSLDPILPHR